MLTIEEMNLVLQMLNEELNRLDTMAKYYEHHDEILKQVIGVTYKERIQLIESTIEKLNKIIISL